jgi:hypothetical protein
MSNYLLVNKETETLEYYNELSLSYKYLMEGLFDMSDIKEVGNIDFLIEDLRFRGILLFNVSQINNLEAYSIETKTGASVLNFDSVYAAIDYCKQKKLSTAGDSYIKNTLIKNLTGKTKSAYGLSWTFKSHKLDISNYKIKVVI